MIYFEISLKYWMLSELCVYTYIYLLKELNIFFIVIKVYVKHTFTEMSLT